MSALPMRYEDYTLSEEQAALQSVVTRFLAARCTPAVVRAAEPLGFDRSLWSEIVALGYLDATPDSAIGDLVLVAEACGRVLAPVPFVETMTARGLLAAHAPEHGIDASRVVSLALHPERDARQLVPAGAVADAVIYEAGDELVLRYQEPQPLVRNPSAAPLAWSTPSASRTVVLAAGRAAHDAFADAIERWRLLTAAALTGLADAATRLGVEFAKTRTTRETPIGALQGVAFPLTQAEIMTSAARGLVHKAAWFLDHEPEARPELAAMALAHAMRTAVFVTETCVHVQGAFGFTMEADIQLYLRRAKGWAQVGATEDALLRLIGDRLAEPRSAEP